MDDDKLLRVCSKDFVIGFVSAIVTCGAISCVQALIETVEPVERIEETVEAVGTVEETVDSMEEAVYKLSKKT